MSLQYRKKVRDAILGLFADPATGFNATLAAMAVTYGIAPFSIDFSGAAGNFAISHIERSNIEVCYLTSFPGACLYTSDIVDNADPKGFSFSGRVMAHLDFYVLDRGGIEGFNTEDEFDAIEDAALSIMNRDANQWPAGILFSRRSQGTRESMYPLGDGYGTKIPIGSLFDVYIP
jgi:hypothetical protein